MTPKEALTLPRRCTREEFRLMRQYLKMTQSDLGRRLGLSDQSIARMEKGHTGIDYASEILVRAMCADQAGLDYSLPEFCERIMWQSRLVKLLKRHSANSSTADSLFTVEAQAVLNF